MFLLKKWPQRLQLLQKLKSDSGSGSIFFTNFWRRVRKKNAESCRSWLRPSGSGPTSDSDQRWATATLKIASLLQSLFAENNSGAALPLLNKDSSKNSTTFGELLQFVLFCRSRVYFTVSPWNVFLCCKFCWVPLFWTTMIWK